MEAPNARFLDLSTLTVEPDLNPTPPAAPARRAPKPFDQAARDERGAELARTALIIGYGLTYLVQGSAAEPYMVDLAAGTCSCPDMGRVLGARAIGIDAACKHQVAAIIRHTGSMPVAA